jgi:hypothetical protein
MDDSLDVKDVRSLDVSPRGEILAGTRGGGVFRCAEVQLRWEHLETGLPNDIRALASARTSGETGRWRALGMWRF